MRFFPLPPLRAVSAALGLAFLATVTAADLDQLRAAARRGDPKALHELVETLGRGDAKARREAFSWYKDIARAGDFDAALDVARAYASGVPAIELEADRYEAEEFYYHALKKSDNALPEVIGFFNAQRLPEPQYHKFALERLLLRAGEGNELAQLLAAQTYATGAIVPKDDAASLGWLQKACDQGGERAKLLYGNWQIEGTVLPQNADAGLKLLGELAAQGSASAAYYAASYYLAGTKVAANPVLAAKYFQQAAEAGVPEAELAYAGLLAAGNGVTRNLGTALIYWEKVADDFPEAAYRAGVAYRDGEGAAKDLRKAADYLSVAAEGGYPGASTALEGVRGAMPVNFVVRDEFLLDAENAVRDGAGCFVQVYSYHGKAGDEVTAEIRARIYDTIHVYKTDTSNLRLLADEGSGKFQPVTGVAHRIRLKNDGRVQFMIATRSPGQKGDAILLFTTTRPTSAGEPPAITRHEGTDYTLKRGDWNVLTLNTHEAKDPLVIRVASESFDPFLEAGPTVGDADNFRAALWDDNSGGGTAARLAYAPGAAKNFMIKLHDNGDDQGGPYRLYVDRVLRWRDTRSILF